MPFMGKMTRRRFKEPETDYSVLIKDCFSAREYYDFREAGLHDGLSLRDYIIAYGSPEDRNLVLTEWDYLHFRERH